VAPGGLDAHVRLAVERALNAPLHGTGLLAGHETRHGRAHVGHRREHRGERRPELVAPAHQADGHHVLDAVLAPVLRHGGRITAVHRVEVAPHALLDGLAAGDPLALRLLV
jgi:hypothetical protein